MQVRNAILKFNEINFINTNTTKVTPIQNYCKTERQTETKEMTSIKTMKAGWKKWPQNISTSKQIKRQRKSHLEYENSLSLK